MKLIKLGLISVIFLFLLVTGISLFIPSTVRISRAVQLNVTTEKLMEQVSNPSNWKNWFPGMDTAMLFYEEGQLKGAVLNATGSRLLLLQQVSDSTVLAEYAGVRQKKVLTGWNVFGDSGTGTVTLQWYMDFSLRWYPWEKFSSILFEKQYGPQMEEGLSRLKQWLENN